MLSQSELIHTSCRSESSKFSLVVLDNENSYALLLVLLCYITSLAQNRNFYNITRIDHTKCKPSGTVPYTQKVYYKAKFHKHFLNQTTKQQNSATTMMLQWRHLVGKQKISSALCCSMVLAISLTMSQKCTALSLFLFPHKTERESKKKRQGCTFPYMIGFGMKLCLF